jgi:P-type Ca2+ transporter type 2C
VTAAEVLQFYSVTEESGLAAGEAEARLARYGPNSLTEAARQGLLSMIAEQFEDRLVQILLVVAVLSGVLSTFEEVSFSALFWQKCFIKRCAHSTSAPC